MKKLAIIIFCIVLLSISVIAADECKNPQSDECKKYLSDLAESAPMQYGAAILADPSLAGANPEAYEKYLRTSPGKIYNARAFESYSQAKGIPGKIQGSMSTSAGVFTTNAQPPLAFTLDQIRATGATGFTVDKTGKLILQFPGNQQAVIKYGKVGADGSWGEE